MRYPPDQRWAYVPPHYEYFRRYMDGEPVTDQRGVAMRIVSHEHLPGGNVKLGLRPMIERKPT